MLIFQTCFKDKNRYCNNEDESEGGDGCALFSRSLEGKLGCLSRQGPSPKEELALLMQMKGLSGDLQENGYSSGKA